MMAVLRDLGFDDWFAGRAAEILQPGQAAARVMAVDRDAFVVADEHGETAATLAGRFRYLAEASTDLPCVGDWVGIERAGPDLAVIQAVFPRRSFLRRKAPGKAVEFQMIAANIDTAFILQSCQYDFNVRRLDRYLVVCREGGIEPVVLLSKTDLASPLEVEGMIAVIRGAGIEAPLIPISTVNGDGLDQFRGLLDPGKTFCFIGSSGVGKSTLVNRLLGREALDTRAVSATGEGTHTTSRRQLLLLDDGTMLIDTPGMRELGLLGTGAGLDSSFADIQELARACRFADCAHAEEPGCAVRAAIEAGELDEARYQGYLKLRKENEYHDASYVERRKKDREFGRYVNSVMKHKRR